MRSRQFRFEEFRPAGAIIGGSSSGGGSGKAFGFAGSKETGSEQQQHQQDASRNSPRNARPSGSVGSGGRPPLPGKFAGHRNAPALTITIPTDHTQQPAMAVLVAPKLEISSTHSVLAELTAGYSAEALFGPPPAGGAGAGPSSAAAAAGAEEESPDMSPHWAANLVMECAKAMAGSQSGRVQHIMWALNELASPYGDWQQRLASYMLQALFCKVTGTGARCYHILCTTAARTYSFDSMRRMMLKFQEASPWTTFGHVAANGALLEAFEGETRVHIVDVSNTLCTQWPTLLESLATRPEGAPSLRLTTVIGSAEESAVKVVRQIGGRLEKFARLMGVPFEFAVLQQPQLEKLEPASLDLRSGEALAVNCIQILHEVSPHTDRGAAAAGEHEEQAPAPAAAGAAVSVPAGWSSSPRDTLLATMRSMGPKIVTLVEHEVDLCSSAVNFRVAKNWSGSGDDDAPAAAAADSQPSFPSAAAAASSDPSSSNQVPPEQQAASSLDGLSEAVRFYSLLFDSLEDSLPRVSNERLMIERTCGRAMVSMLACDDGERSFWQEKGSQWGARLCAAGFAPSPFNDDVVDDVRALLKRYRQGWGLATSPSEVRNNHPESCLLYLTWKHQPAVFASAWKPI